ncbi:MAG: DUF58 domain-containing protein [Mariniblastus sp.]|nr:DUF58 domain-containing protein [Mariniblastus sp.]
MLDKLKRSRSKISLTPEGWIFLVILVFVTVGAILRNVNLLVIMSGMMFAPLMLGWRIGSHMVRHTEARRLVPQRIHVGKLVNFQWMIRNRSRLPMWNFGVRDDMRCVASPWTQESAKLKKSTFNRSQLTFRRVSIGEAEYSSYRCLFMDRGLYEVGPAVVSSRFPFGLIKAWFRLANREAFYVAPRLGRLRPAWERRIASHVVGAESALRRRGLDDEEFYALRNWRSGDSRRQIHWRTTAKANELMVKQFDQKTNRDMAIVLDLFSSSDSGAIQEQEQLADCERVLSFAATLMLQGSQDIRGKIGFAVVGQESYVDVDLNGDELLVRLMRELSVARATRNPQVSPAILQLHAGVAVATPIFVISSRPCPEQLLEEQIGTQRWRSLRTDLHWLTVGTPEFDQIFLSDEESDREVLNFLKGEVSDAST